MKHCMKHCMNHWMSRIFSGIMNVFRNSNVLYHTSLGEAVKLYAPYKIRESSIGSYTYVAFNSQIRNVEIGKFCSIGPHFFAGWGIHPTEGISTSPCFYSTKKQNGITFSKTDKIVERQPIKIGNDVFIGANVTVLDGVTVGNGAIIGAGAVVAKDIPPYAIAIGNPLKIVRFRFADNVIEKLQNIAWWNFSKEKLSLVEKYFLDVDSFIEACENKIVQ